MNNPIDSIKMFMQGGRTPQQLVQQVVQKNNPMLSNLIGMAQKGDSKSLETFARNVFKEKGRDFDKEFSAFMSNFK